MTTNPSAPLVTAPLGPPERPPACYGKAKNAQRNRTSYNHKPPILILVPGRHRPSDHRALYRCILSRFGTYMHQYVN